MGEETNIWYLENVDMLKFICPSRRGKTDGTDYSQVFKKGEFVYFPDQPSLEVFLLEKGRVKIGSYSDDGKEIIKAILSPGELFGELALVGEEKRSDFAVAMEDDTTVCHMPLQEMRDIMYQDIQLSLRITKLIGLRLQKMERRLESLVFKDARTRIIEFIRDLATDRGTKVGDETLVKNFFTHKEIASLTGTSRQTVTSVLNELRDANLIYFDRKRLLVRDLSRLE
jgi:CRP-like cAMP-binding protein